MNDAHCIPLVWDQHGCLPLRPDAGAVDQLDLYRRAGVDVVSVNVGMDVTPRTDAMEIAGAFRRGIERRARDLQLITSPADLEEARRANRLAVFFDLEGTEPLDGDASALALFHELGVRAVLIAYNKRNRAGGGCHDRDDTGLTAFGRDVVAEMNRLGIIVDATHCARRTTFDIFECSSQPVVFSHVVPLAVKRHERNVSDDQMRACADTGGVVGINGVGIFLGDNDNSTTALVRAIDYAVGVVGTEHVGLGLDYVFDQAELRAFVAQQRDTFPSEAGYSEDDLPRFVSPLQIGETAEELRRLGYAESAIAAILGGNFRRVAETVWR